MIEPAKPKVPDKYIDQYIYSTFSDSMGTFEEVVCSIREQLIQKGYSHLLPLNLNDISFEFDHCSSYSSCSFSYALAEEKPKEIFEEELKRYKLHMKLYEKQKKTYDNWKKSKIDKKLQERKRLYEKLKKEFENVKDPQN